MAGTRNRRVLAVLFAIYLVLLVWIVLWKLHDPFIGRDEMRDIKLIPFVSGDGFGLNDPVELAANLLLFVPFGVYLGALATTWRWGRVLLVALGASVLLEVVQYLTAVGSSDVADVIVNTAGALAGFALLRLVTRRLGDRAPRLVTAALAVGTVLAIVACGLVIATFPRMPPGSGVVIIE